MDTFVLRIWTPASAAGDPNGAEPGTHGTAQHIASGRSGVFRTDEQLVRLLVELRRDPTPDRTTATSQAAHRDPIAVPDDVLR